MDQSLQAAEQNDALSCGMTGPWALGARRWDGNLLSAAINHRPLVCMVQTLVSRRFSGIVETYSLVIKVVSFKPRIIEISHKFRAAWDTNPPHVLL